MRAHVLILVIGLVSAAVLCSYYFPSVEKMQAQLATTIQSSIPLELNRE